MQILIQWYPSDAHVAGSDHTWSGRPYGVSKVAFGDFSISVCQTCNLYWSERPEQQIWQNHRALAMGILGPLLCAHEQRHWDPG